MKYINLTIKLLCKIIQQADLTETQEKILFKSIEILQSV